MNRFRSVIKWLFFCALTLFILINLLSLIIRYGVEFRDNELSAPAGTKFEKIGEDTIAYSEIDNNSPVTVIFVGGLSAWHGTWQRTVDVLSKKTYRWYNYIALDLPPFGYSTIGEDGNFFRDTQADRLIEFINLKKIQNSSLQRIILVAHSYGAGPSAEAVMKAPELFLKFIIIDGVLNIDETKRATPPFFIQSDYVRNLAVSIFAHTPCLVKNRLKSFVHVTDNIDSDLVDVYTQYFTTRGTTKKLSQWLHDYMNDPLDYASTKSSGYAALTLPVRIIWGEKDTLTPPALIEKLTDHLTNAKVYNLSGVGHIPMIEDYAAFDEALEKALRE